MEFVVRSEIPVKDNCLLWLNLIFHKTADRLVLNFCLFSNFNHEKVNYFYLLSDVLDFFVPFQYLKHLVLCLRYLLLL